MPKKDLLEQANEVGRLILKMDLSPGLKRKKEEEEENTMRK